MYVPKLKTGEISKISLFSALICISAVITVPFFVPFTLQTFAVALSGLVLGRKNGVISIIIYLLLGAVGLPVFSGFRGGIMTLFGATGGYILGFLPLVWFSGLYAKKNVPLYKKFLSSLLGLLVCYIFGTFWYAIIYMKELSIGYSILSVCVFPFIVPDIVKLFLAVAVSKRLKI